MQILVYNRTTIARALIAVAIIGLVAVQSASAGSNFPQQGDIETLRKIVSAGFEEQYAEAESLAISLQWEYPYHPIGFIMQAAMLQSKMLDYEHTDHEREFYTLIELTKKKARDHLEMDDTDAWCYYCLGLAHGSHAVFESRSGSWFTALKQGIRAKKAFAKCIETDPGFYDAYVGLGSYHYWRTVKTGIVNWLPFVQDDREEGVEELSMAADSGRFSGDFARDALIWVYIDMKEFEKAESLAVQMKYRFPNGRKFLWGMAFAQAETGKYDDALHTYEDLLAKVISDLNRVNYFNEIEIRRQIAECAFNLGQYDDVAEQARVVTALEISPDIHKRAENSISRLHELAKKGEERLHDDAYTGSEIEGKSGN